VPGHDSPRSFVAKSVDATNCPLSCKNTRADVPVVQSCKSKCRSSDRILISRKITTILTLGTIKLGISINENFTAVDNQI
jgi:hypothetical protein